MTASKTKEPLPLTLSQRVQFLREELDMSKDRLSKKANVPKRLIDDIESGLETFLSPAIRSKLARALRIRTYQLLEVEKRPKDSYNGQTDPEHCEALLDSIDAQPERACFCPLCGKPLNVRFYQRRDLDNSPVTAIKINCTQCLFTLSRD